MTEAELVTLVNAEMERAMGHPEGEIAQERAKAWKRFYQEPLGNEVEGSSEFVTSDVSDVVEDVIPSLLRIFTTVDNLVEFEPVGREDVAAARQESDYISWIFFRQNPAFDLLYTWFFDALLEKVGYVEAYWDEREITTRESYDGLSDDQLAALLADESLELLEQETTTGENAETAIDPRTGEATTVVAEAPVHRVVFRRTERVDQPVVVNVPPEEMRISPDTRGMDLSKSRMVGRERVVPRTELLEMGFDPEVVDRLPTTSEEPDSPEQLARETRSEERDDERTGDRSQDPIRIRDVYQRVDFDEDGRAELRHVFIAGGEVLLNEEVDRQPFHAICPQPLPHKHVGRSWAEKVFDLHELNTTLHRQILNNLYHTNSPQLGVWKQALGETTLDDLLTVRAGAVKLFDRPVAESVQTLSVPFTAGHTFPMLEVIERHKQQRTGVSGDAQGLTADALKNIQQSVMAQALDLKRMKIEMVARVFAETGLRSLFLHLHELARKHQRSGRVARLRNQWVEVDPTEWRARRNMSVTIGLGLGTREQNLLHLEAIYEKQVQAWQNGGAGVLVSPRNLFNTYAAMVRNANLMDPETFFLDPGDGPVAPQQGEGDAVAQLQSQVAQLQAQVQVREQDIDRERNMLQHQRELAKIELDRQKQRSDLAVELEKIRNQLTKLELDSGRNVPGSKV